MKKLAYLNIAFLLAVFCSTVTIAQSSSHLYDTEEEPMMRGVTQNIKNGWSVDPLFTVGETDNNGTDYSQENFGYRVPGIFDGMYAFKKSAKKIDLFVNHELSSTRGYTYSLENGTQLTGARVSKFRVEQKNEEIGVRSVELAYDRIYYRYYTSVTNASQINEGIPGSLEGLDRLCSASGIEKNKYGFKSNIFFTGEETSGGQEFALDVDNEDLYCVPAMGRAAWESVCVLDNFYSNKVVLIAGDDRAGAPLIMYIGQKNVSFTNPTPNFLKNNGLAKGYLFVWVADNGDLTPQDWNGTGTSRSGKFVRIENWNPSMAGQPGWDNAGWADQSNLDAQSAAVGKFSFSRPEDVATNPYDGTQVVFASTGRDSQFPADSWGTTYLIDLNDSEYNSALSGSLESINNISAEITILYDGDDAGAGQFQGPDYGLRSPDNLEWAEDGFIYVNEDRSVGGFCSTSGIEASVWQINPETGTLTRILEMDRSSVPFQQDDVAPADCGNWESSGTIDITRFFQTESNETLLLLNVQAHSNTNALKPDSPIGGNNDLVEGSQLIIASKVIEPINPIHNTNISLSEDSIQQAESNIILYPNPANDTVNLTEEMTFKVFDIMGKEVLSGTKTRTFDVSKLNPGIYILKSENGDSLKFRVQRN